MRHFLVLLGVVGLLASGCSDSPSNTRTDAGGEDQDSGGGSEIDAGHDAGPIDAGHDAGPIDAGKDSGAGDCTPGETRACGETEAGACSFGLQTCDDDATWGACEGAVGPAQEKCDEVDNDCDGETDEEVAKTFYRDGDKDGAGGATTQDACKDPDGKKKLWIAVGGDCDDEDAAVAPGKAELCDGKDNDCANGADDGLTAIPADNVVGPCSANTKTCDGANGYVDSSSNYAPVAETCDGIDNDCNDDVDDGLGAVPADNVAGACAANTKICDGVNGYIDNPSNHVPVLESCDGIDNDCQNGADDGLGEIPAANVAGACAGNVRVCDGENGYVNKPGSYVPVAEICDGIDNDCQNGADDGLPEIAADNVAGACANNKKFCYGANGYVDKLSNYEPVPEVCDGIDNDCQNGADDGMTPVPADNVQGACSGNTKVCDGSNGYVDRSDNYTPVAEVCDGIDNDCQNGVDDGMTPRPANNVQGACSGNTRVCDGANGYVRNPSNYVPSVEVCDGIDNDCANGVDNGLGPIPATNVAGACSGNTRVCLGVSGYVNSPSNYVATAEVCDGLDNDCNGGVDNGLPELAADNVLGACSNNKKVCGGTAGYIAKATNFVPTATDASCNGVDDDCSGAADEDYVPDTSCFLPGECAGDNVASSCSPTMETPCESSDPAFAVDQCAGKDDNCDGLVDQCWTQLAGPGQTCQGCRKDLFAGRYVYCNGFYAGSLKTNCDWDGNNCQFPPIQSVTKQQCEVLCQNEPGCKFYTYYTNGSICNLHLMTSCTTESAQFSGIVYRKQGCTPTAANDVTCDGNDDDCNGEIDEDFVSDTSCFKPGACSAGNRGSSCNFAQVTACKAGTPASATDTTCNGIDDDCSGAADEDWTADSSCFKQGECAAGNEPSQCNAGVLTACQTDQPTTTEDLCTGADDNCDGTVDTVCYNKLTNNEQKTCGGCYKDMFAGRYVYCNGYYPKATKTGCNWEGSNCTFAPDKTVTATECKQLCRDEPGCYFFTSHYDSICNLHLMTECTQQSSGAPGSIYQKQVSCVPTAQNDVTCNGVDDDCDGQEDEDWTADTSCFKPGVCAAGNQASTCNDGVHTACQTGAAAPADLCEGLDNNCDGTVSTTCFTQLTTNENSTCKGCYKDMFAGKYVYCDGTYPEATKTGCDWVGGTGSCTFPANKNVTAGQCQTMCENEPGCYFFTSYYNSICNLHLMRSCQRETTGAAGNLYKKNVSCIPLSQTDATCDGVDDDCSGQADEDFVADSSCFKPGVCAAGNQASSCNNGVLTACHTGAPASQFDQCNGQDGNCDGTTDTACWTEVTHNDYSTCGGCYKDLYAGQYVYCDGYYEGATRDDCDWVGGPGDCTFPRQTSVTAQQCRDLCEEEPGCSYVTSYYDSICNLHLMTSCSQEEAGAPGSIFASPDACIPIYEDDSSCDGVDDDCDGDIDEDYVPDTSCFQPGVCAAGNVASECSSGVEIPCEAGSPAAAEDLCMGEDDNCDGAVDTVCFTRLTTNETKTCSGCRKDLFMGAYINCNGGVAGATKTNCPSASGGAGCTFAADTSVTREECLDLCEDEPGCYFATSYTNGACNLHLMSSCTQVNAGAPGSIFRVDGCIPTSSTDTTCDGRDDDCSGIADEDYVAKTACFKPGVCATGNVASSCSLGVEVACKTGAATAPTDQCAGKDDNCDGTVTTCSDTDGDGIADPNDSCGGDNASGNSDSDTICNDLDNCPNHANSTQTDSDRDGIGDACDNCANKASTDLTDTDNDGIGNVCDPDFVPPSNAPPNSTDSRGCGFTPQCPGPSYNAQAYLFSCYDEACLGDRWWYLLNRRIYPMMVGDQPAHTTEGKLEELERPEYNAPVQSCTSTPQCPSGANCIENVCLYPAVQNFIDRLSYASDFLSCTGTNSYENTWPASRVLKLDSGPCGWQTFGWKSSYGYRVVNTLSEPMTIWVGRGASSSTNDADKRWWTLWPGEEIKFNSHDVAYVFPTGAAAYHACSPTFMTKTVYSENLTPPSFTQVSPTPMVEYKTRNQDGSYSAGALTIYRDKYLKTDIDLFEYPNYFGIGLGPKGTNGNKPLYGFMAVAVPPSVGARYPELTCF